MKTERPRRWAKGLMLVAIGLSVARLAFAESTGSTQSAILKQIQLLNQLPEDQINEKTDPAFSILRKIYDQDGPDFLVLRQLAANANVRSHLNPSTRCVLAGIISQRWDTFTLSGNLYLSGLRSPNPDLRDKARRKLVCFIQPAHIPPLIDLLNVPGTNAIAYEILREVTGQHLPPKAKPWHSWWLKGGSKTDIVGHLLNDTRSQLTGHTIDEFDQEKFWYVPTGIKDTQLPEAKRSETEQHAIADWNSWANSDVKRYTDDWSRDKPILDRIIHHPDPRINKYLETLVSDAGRGDYASVVLAWRSSAASLSRIRAANKTRPTVGRALARGSLGDKTALITLLEILDRHQTDPLTYKIMDDDARALLSTLRTVGVVSAEQAFELLTHNNFGFDAATTPREKKAAFKKAKNWLRSNAARLMLDRRRGYYILSNSEK